MLQQLDTVELLNGVWEFRSTSSHCQIAWSASFDRCDDTIRLEAGKVQYSVEKGGSHIAPTEVISPGRRVEHEDSV